MTAEVAILNKTAVALAADSAITIGNKKIYNSGNKLFALSKYHPVGIMIFENAEFLGIPWETIIKYYRSKLKDKKFSSLVDYASDFINFIETESEILWPKDTQIIFFQEYVEGLFRDILKEINVIVDLNLDEKKISTGEIKEIVRNVVDGNFRFWNEAKNLHDDYEEYINNIYDNYDEKINSLIEKIFQKLPISNKVKKQLRELSVLIYNKEKFSNSYTGIVIAGFGNDEIFPSALEYRFETLLLGKLKYVINQHIKADLQRDAVIMPFAQKEMVQTFVEGIDPVFKVTLYTYFKELFENYPEDILDTIDDIDNEKKNELLIKLRKISEKTTKDFQKNVDQYIGDYHVSPVLQAVYALPKDELASMAESLVNLTSFKKKITLQTETVGGPIDVAVISKGDGYIWIKRKHYFKPELNQVFMANYYREDCE